jgi:aldose 1-epimerase
MPSLGLSVPGVGVTLDPMSGGRIRQVSVDGRRLLHDTPGDGSDPTATGWGSFPMAPFAGRVRHGRFVAGGVEHVLERRNGDHAMHGTVLDRPWEVREHTPTRCVLRTDLGPGWPWDGWCEQHLDLSAERLVMRLEVHSEREAFPTSAGWHPWFRTRLDGGGALRLDVTAGSMVRRDPEGIPSGVWGPPTPRPWDDCLGDITWPVRLRWEIAGSPVVGIDISADTRFVVVYDEPDHAWCVEPQSAPPDALGDPTHVVSPDQPHIVTCEWRWIRSVPPYLSGE